MKTIAFSLLAVLLAACHQSEKPQKADIPTVESLLANPERLKEFRRQCRLDRAQLGDAFCNRVAEATNRQFFGDGNTPYTPSKEKPKF